VRIRVTGEHDRTVRVARQPHARRPLASSLLGLRHRRGCAGCRTAIHRWPLRELRGRRQRRYCCDRSNSLRCSDCADVRARFLRPGKYRQDVMSGWIRQGMQRPAGSAAKAPAGCQEQTSLIPCRIPGPPHSTGGIMRARSHRKVRGQPSGIAAGMCGSREQQRHRWRAHVRPGSPVSRSNCG